MLAAVNVKCEVRSQTDLIKKQFLTQNSVMIIANPTKNISLKKPSEVLEQLKFNASHRRKDKGKVKIKKQFLIIQTSYRVNGKCVKRIAEWFRRCFFLNSRHLLTMGLTVVN